MKNLTFSDYIRSLDSKTVLEHLLDGQSEGILGETVYKEVEETFMAPESISKRWNSLNEELQGLLFTIYLSGTLGFPVKKLSNQKDRQTLLQTFIVYEGTRSGESYLLGLEDLKPFVFDYVSDKIGTGFESLKIHRDTGVLSDSATLLSLIKDGKIKRRQDGLLQKSSVESFLRSSVLQIHLSKRSELKSEPFLELLLIYLVKADVIRYDNNGFYVMANGEMNWARRLDVVHEEVLSKASEMSVFSHSSTLLEFFRNAGSCSSDEVKQWGMDSSLVLLLWCGELAEDERSIGRGSDPIQKMTVTGHIMPDFSVMIPREIDPVELLTFFDIGEIESVDVIYKGVVSKMSVVNALSRGISGEALMDVFKKWNASPHLLHTVQEWIYSFERVFVDGHYLGMNTAVADHLLSTPELQSAVIEIPSYRFFRITPGREIEVTSALEKMGFDTRFPNAQEIRQVEHNRSNLELTFPVKPVFSPELERKEPVQTNFGRYGGALKKCNAGELLKMVRYAIFMDEKLAVLIENESEPQVITPSDVKTGDNGELSGKDEEGNSISFSLNAIDKIGVVSDS